MVCTFLMRLFSAAPGKCHQPRALQSRVSSVIPLTDFISVSPEGGTKHILNDEFCLAKHAEGGTAQDEQGFTRKRILLDAGQWEFSEKTSTQARWPDNLSKPPLLWPDTGLGCWTSLPAAPTVNSGGDFVNTTFVESVKALDLLVQRGASIDASLFSRVLKGCIAQKNLTLGRRVHALALEKGYESNSFLANQLICMYASHGRLPEAMEVFVKVPGPSRAMWASIILAHVRCGKPMDSLKLYRRMRETKVKPDNHTFVAALRACTVAGDLSSGKEVHVHILETTIEPDRYVNSCLVDMYAKCGSLVDSRKVFDELQSRDAVTWNAMLAGYSQHGLGHEALALYAQMEKEGIPIASTVTFVCLLKACASVGALHWGKQLHAELQRRALEVDVVVGSCLVNMYAKCGSLEDAFAVFDRLPQRDVVTWNSMIAGYVQHGRTQEAVALYASMQEQGVVPNYFTYSCLLKACAGMRDLQLAKQFHAQIDERGLKDNALVGNCLVDVYATCGSLDEARTVFNSLRIKDVVSWTIMISGYARHGLGQDALCMYAKMHDDGVIPANSATYVSLLQACTSMGALHQGKQLHAHIQERGLEADLGIANCLVDMYAKCGNLVEARRVFNRVPTRDVVTWTALLNGYAKSSDRRMVMETFEEMLRQGVEPDGASFICLLGACSHWGLVDEGHQYFNRMVERYGIVPSAHHYNCMIDLLGRSGRLAEAEKILQSTPFVDDVVAWRTLLSACKVHDDVERGRRCFDHLTKLEPSDARPYVLLANIYARLGNWKEVNRIENLRRCAGAKKKPGKACIEVEKKVHEFTVGEGRADIASKLSTVNRTLKAEGGHVPHTELVLKAVTEREKEDALCGHAEKLALAYGLLNTSDGTTLFVTKNLRMCNDCHSGTKIMSRLEKRKIIVRDAYRVHHFMDGACSCGDRH